MATIREQFQKAQKVDGKDHINVSLHGATHLGRLTYPETYKKFFIPHVGEFLSARNFANWCVSGGDEKLRHSSTFVKIKVDNLGDFYTLMLYAKYWQLASVNRVLMENKALLDLPWSMYKVHASGIREYNRWEDYPSIVKQMVEDIITNGVEKPDLEKILPGHVYVINHYLSAIVGDDFVGIENIDRIVAEKKEADRLEAERRKAGQAKKAQENVNDTPESENNPEAPVVENNSALEEASEQS